MRISGIISWFRWNEHIREFSQTGAHLYICEHTIKAEAMASCRIESVMMQVGVEQFDTPEKHLITSLFGVGMTTDFIEAKHSYNLSPSWWQYCQTTSHTIYQVMYMYQYLCEFYQFDINRRIIIKGAALTWHYIGRWTEDICS